jgi:stage V sporulation protein G
MNTQAIEIKVNKIFKMNNHASLKAFASITVNDAILIKGFKVIDGSNGPFVSMPQDQGKDKKWYDSVRCLHPEIKQQITDEILGAYQLME